MAAAYRRVDRKVAGGGYRVAGAAALLLGCALAAAALEPSTPLANYVRQSWGMENGLPQNTVQTLAQTRDGFLWMGTESGLVRFDGNGFQVFDRNARPALPGNDIRCLLESRDGALWIGTSEGLARWKDGEAQTFTAKDGLPGNEMRGLAEDESGHLWAWTQEAQARLEGSRFIAYGTVSAIAGGGARPSVFLPPTSGWLPQPLAGGDTVLANKSALRMIRGDRVIGRVSVGHELPGSRIQSLFADREGSLWIGTNAGLARWIDGKVQRLPVTDALATASVLTIFEDREGDLWVGTESDGLHILRDQRFRTLGAREGLSSDRTTAVVEDRAGTLWVGTQGWGLNALRRSGVDAGAGRLPGWKLPTSKLIRTWSVRDGLASDVILSLAAAPNGDLWVGTPDGLNRIRGGTVTTFTSADGLPDDFIRSLLVDADGSLWAGTRRGLVHLVHLVHLAHLARWENGTGAQRQARMEVYTQASGLGSDLVGAMARDTNGDLWVATLAGLSRLRAGKISNFTISNELISSNKPTISNKLTGANGLTGNVITALLPRADGTLLIGTQDHGWNQWAGQRFSAAVKSGLDQTAIHAILDDGSGHLWFATGNGIARCTEISGAISGAIRGAMGGAETGCSDSIEFSTADGLRSRETATNSHPSAWRSRDGELWFATPKGLVEVDPAHFPVNTLAPPVALERFAVDDVDQLLPGALRGADSGLRLQAGHVHFEFDYAGLSFVAPQKVRYRYRLDGFDRGWTEAGARRSAYYTNIPPGRYTFRVQAANNDGLWSTTGAALGFELRPFFYQRAWFYALLAAGLIAGLVLLLRQRLRRAEREFRAVLGERSRIAREIHDTLAQGYVGISVQLEVMAEMLRQRKVEEAARHLDLTRDSVRDGLADARQSIWALRSQTSRKATLPVRLRRIVEAAGGAGLQSALQSRLQSRFSIFGAYRPLPEQTEREILRVAQEAIHNVKKHAGAKQLSVQLEYGTDWIALEVRDDGRGGAGRGKLEPAPGHFGLTGMRERAAAMGGTLEVSSEPEGGTAIRLRAPAPGITQERARDSS